MKNIKQYLTLLREVYPPFLLALVFSPILIGFMIDYDLSDSREIAINLVWLTIFTIPALLFQKKIIYYTASCLYFFAGVIEITHWIILNGPPTITSLLVVSNTNFQETIEFFDIKSSFGLLILLPYLALFILTLKNPPIQTSSFKGKKYILTLLILMSSIFILENTINNRLIRKGSPQLVKLSLSFINKIKLYNEVLKKQNRTKLMHL